MGIIGEVFKVLQVMWTAMVVLITLSVIIIVSLVYENIMRIKRKRDDKRKLILNKRRLHKNPY